MHGWGVAVALIWYCMAQRVLITALAQCWLRLAVSSAVWGGMGERFWWLHGRCRVGQLVTEYALVTSGGASITMTGEGQGLAKTYLWVTKCSVNKSGTKVTSKELGWCRGDRLAVTSKDLVEWTTTHLSPPPKKNIFGPYVWHRSFSVAGRRLWNALPPALRQTDACFDCFKRLYSVMDGSLISHT